MAAMLALSLFTLDLCAAEKAPLSKTEQALVDAEANQTYTMLLFYKDDSPAARAMAASAKAELTKRPGEATLTYVQVANPEEKALVERFGVSRAPMPLLMAVAPNGAITGIFPQKLTAENVDSAFVTPTMMRVMKSLQTGKLVLVCVEGSESAVVPAAVVDFQKDPHFKDRLTTVSFQAADPTETKFLGQMKIDSNSSESTTVLLAPPGVMVGKFSADASMDEIAAALAKAGKCCDDPNCKHHHHAPKTAPQTATQPPRTRR
jgi:hypothetical protein